MKEIETSRSSSELWGALLAQLCQFPDDPTWQKQALACLQISFNDDGNTQERAVLRITEAIEKTKRKQGEAKATLDATAATAADPTTYAFSASELAEQVEPFDSIETAKIPRDCCSTSTASAARFRGRRTSTPTSSSQEACGKTSSVPSPGAWWRQ